MDKAGKKPYLHQIKFEKNINDNLGYNDISLTQLCLNFFLKSQFDLLEKLGMKSNQLKRSIFRYKKYRDNEQLPAISICMIHMIFTKNIDMKIA